MAVNFSLDLKQFSKQISTDLSNLTRKVALDLWGNITRRTPVDTGRARGSWFVTINTPSEKARKKVAKGIVLPAPVRPQIQASTNFFITNNLPYIKRLEYGYSKQAPYGMVRVSLAETKAKMAARVKSRSK